MLIGCAQCGAKLDLPAGAVPPRECATCGGPTYTIMSGEAVAEENQEWHRQLLATLRDTGVNRPSRGSIFLLAGLAALGVVIVGKLSSIFADNLNHTGDSGDYNIMLTFSMLWIAFTYGLGDRLTFLAGLARQRYWALSADRAIERDTTKRPIFYLRSFGIDQRLARLSWLDVLLDGFIARPRTLEESLAKYLRRLGPVIAIGRPGEAAPEVGAARFYVTDERWQEKVAEVARLSRLVVWTTGFTPGLHWELSHLLSSLPPEKLVLWAHPHLLKFNRQQREAEWQRFLSTFGSLFPRGLPTRLGRICFIYFTAGFEPHGVASDPWALTPAQAHGGAALRMLTAKGLIHPLPGSWRTANWPLRLLFGVVAAVLANALMIVFINPLRFYLSGGSAVRYYTLLSETIYDYGYGSVGSVENMRHAMLASFGFAAVLGLIFILVQPLLIRSPGGYRAGIALFAASWVVIVDYLLLPLVGVAASPVAHWKSLMLSFHPFGFPLSYSIPPQIGVTVFAFITPIFWTILSVFLMAMILRALPWGPGRPAAPRTAHA
jgi:hypothetical protein